MKTRTAFPIQDPEAAQQPQRRRPWPLRLLAWVVAVALCGALAVVGVVAALWPLTPGVASSGQRVGSFLAQHHDQPLPALPTPDPVGQAVVATENSRFRVDFGLDPVSMVRTIFTVLTGNRDQGAATLEMQLAKNLYTPRRASLTAKAEQVELSFKIDAAFSKQQVLLMYLNAAYYGHNFYGLDAASQGYFGVAPQDLDWSQASMLAGLVQAPSAYDPYVHLALAKSRQSHVLQRLVATGVLTRAQADTAYRAPLHLR